MHCNGREITPCHDNKMLTEESNMWQWSIGSSPETRDGGCSEKRLNWHAFPQVLSVLLAFVLNTVFLKFKIFACKTNYEKIGLQVYMFGEEICYLFGWTKG